MSKCENEGGRPGALFSFNINDNLRFSLDALNLLRRYHFEFSVDGLVNPYDN